MRLFRGHFIAAALFACATPALAGCAALGAPPGSPSELADKTTLDEKGLLGVELAYSAARTLAEIGVDAGLIKGATATRVASLDNQAYTKLELARTAYSLGNATTYAIALEDARTLIGSLLATVKGGRP